MSILSILENLIDSMKGDFMKVQVIMDEDFVKRLDLQAKANGLSRSAYINSVMVRHVSQEEARSAGFARILHSENKEKK